MAYDNSSTLQQQQQNRPQWIPYELLKITNPPLQASATGLFVSWSAFTAFLSITLFLYWRRRDLQPIKSRMPLLCCLSAIFGWLSVTIHAFEAFYTGPYRWPCFVRHWTLYVIIPCTLIAYPFRAFRLLMVARLANFIASVQDRSGSLSHGDDTDDVPVDLSMSNPMKKQAEVEMTDFSGREQKVKKLSASAFQTSSSSTNQHTNQHSSNPRVSPCLRMTACCTAAKTAEIAHITVVRNHIRNTNVYAAICVLMFMLVAAITHATNAQSHMYGCAAPSLRGAVSYTIFASVVLLFDLGFMVWLGVSGVSDNFSIRTELQISFCTKIIFIIPYLIFDFLTMNCSTISAILPTETPLADISSIEACIWIPLSYWAMFAWVLASYLTSIGMPLWQSLESGERALRREYEMKSTSLTKRSSKMLTSLNKLLENTEGYESFLNFLKSEYSMENLLFFTAATKYQNKRMWRNTMDKYQAANNIYEKYIKPNVAPFEINLPAKVKKPIVDLFSGNGASAPGVRLFIEVKDGIFEDAVHNIYHLMESDSFPRFRRSPMGIKLKHRNVKKNAWRKSLVEAHMT